MKHRKFTKQQEKDMKEIVDFYMQYVTGEHFSIRESLEYFWKCMSDYTIEDYLEVAREGKANMNNEPVAWMDGEGGFYHNDDYEVCKEHNIADDLIPLYTHPVKELTDEKITEIAKEILKDYKNFHHYQIDFARAVIKEVSGK